MKRIITYIINKIFSYKLDKINENKDKSEFIKDKNIGHIKNLTWYSIIR